MTFCDNCGCELSGEENYCQKCGKETHSHISNSDTAWVSYKPPVKETKKRKTGYNIFASIVVLVVLCFVVNQLSHKTSKEHLSDRSSNQFVTSSESEIPEPSFSKVTTTLSNWEITVNDFNYEESISVGLLHEYRAEDGCKYCVIDLTVKNCGKESEVFLPFVTFDGDSVAKIRWNGYEYTRSELFFADDTLSSEGLNPLVSATGRVIFEMPKDVETSDIIPVLVITANKESFECELVKSQNGA